MDLLKISSPQNRQKDPPRSINWHEHTTQALLKSFPEFTPACQQLTNRLSALLFERLPAPLCQKILSLLPEETTEMFSEIWRPFAQSQAETSIGYLDFVDRVLSTLGVAGLKTFDASKMESRKTAERVADTFLWSIAQDFPAELKLRITENIPTDLRSRMNLFSSHSDEFKVA